MGMLKGALLGSGLLGAGLVYRGFSGLLGLVWSTWAGLVYLGWFVHRGFCHLPITGQQRAAVLEDEVDDTHLHTHRNIQTYEQT